MHRIIRKFALAASAAGAVATLGTPAVFAAGPHLSPPNTKVIASTQSLSVNFQLDGFLLIMTCTSLTARGTTPARGVTITLAKPPVISGCTDNTGNTDTFTTTGNWSVTANSTGSMLTFDIPRHGATFVSGFFSPCTIVVGPKGPTKLVGTYNNSNTLTFGNAPFAVAKKGKCKVSPTARATSTVTFSPSVSVVP